MEIQVHGAPLGQNEFNTFFHVSVPGGSNFAQAQTAINQHFYDTGYYGARIEGKFTGQNDGRDHYKVAAYKE